MRGHSWRGGGVEGRICSLDPRMRPWLWRGWMNSASRREFENGQPLAMGFLSGADMHRLWQVKGK